MMEVRTISIPANTTSLLVLESEPVDVFFLSPASSDGVGVLDDLSNANDRFNVPGFPSKLTLPPNQPLYGYSFLAAPATIKLLVVSLTGPKICFIPGE